jgi:ribonuclease HI
MLYGCAPDTTCNRMELRAVVSAIRRLKQQCVLDILAGSEYLTNCIHRLYVRSASFGASILQGLVKNCGLWREIYNPFKRQLGCATLIRNVSDRPAYFGCASKARLAAYGQETNVTIGEVPPIPATLARPVEDNPWMYSRLIWALG